MANARTRKLELERAKRTKAAQKRERRQDKATEDEAAAAAAAEDPTTTEPDPQSDVEVLTSLQLLHERFADGEMAFDDFEEAKNDLMQKLDVR
jgi:hypothetical protein